MDSILEAQADMRQAYLNGAPGAISSGSIWVLAGVVAYMVSPMSGILTLVIGGMFIFPFSLLIGKLLGCRGKHNKSNPLAPLAMENTFWMLLSIPIALVLAIYKQEYFFPAMMLVIGGRYLTFCTLYGLKIYYALAITLVVFAILVLAIKAPMFVGGLTGGVIELVFAVRLMRKQVM